MRSNARKRSSTLIRIGLLLIGAAVLLVAYNIWDDNRAGRSVERALADMPELVQEEKDTEGVIQEVSYPDYVLDPNRDMPEITVDGVRYIGVIEIPALDRRLPVMGEWSYPNLKIAPCRYSGSPYSGNFIICGHNYRRHFGGFRQLREGDRILFTDAEGNVFTYAVAQTEQVSPDEPEYMASGDWDLTLFTCTLGGQFRFTVRCLAVDTQREAVLQGGALD